MNFLADYYATTRPLLDNLSILSVIFYMDASDLFSETKSKYSNPIIFWMICKEKTFCVTPQLRA
jgi:hypothetical protein